MRALLLAAGFGTRLRPLTDTIPKCLMLIHGRPLLQYWLDGLFADPRIERVLVNTHYLAPEVEAFVAASTWRARVDLVHEAELLGTGGTILHNRSWLGAEPFFLAHADNLTDASPTTLIDAHLTGPNDVLLTMLAFRTPTPRSCGILELSADDRVLAFHEKVAAPPGNLANGAIYMVEPAVMDWLAALGGPPIDLSTQVIPALIPHIRAVEHHGFFADIGTPEALAQARAAFPIPP